MNNSKNMQRISSKKKYSLVGIITITIVAVFLFSKIHRSAKQNAPITQAVKTISAKEADKNMPLEISGFVRGENRADIAPMTSGKILRIFKHEGQSIKKGEVLAIIDTNQSDAQITAAQANVDALQKTLEDSKKYYDQLVDQAEDGSSSDNESIKSAKRGRDLQIQTVKNQLIATQGALEIARVGRNNSTMVAPFSGTIIAINGREGGFANFSMPLISIATQDNKEIETYVSATDGRGITVGTVATMKTSNGKPISGLVTAVSAGSDMQSLKTLVRIHIDDESDNIYLGDFLHGEVLIPRLENAVSIPRNAVVSRGGDQIVFTLDENNTAKEQPVIISSEHNGMINVIEGISVNQKIVVQGQQYLTNGSTTKPYESN